MSLHPATATRVFLIAALAAISAQVHAADGTIRIKGAVVEPACTVSTTALGFGQEALQQARRTRRSAATPLELSMYCNARQAIQLSMIQPSSKTRAGFDTGIDGVRLQLQREGREVTPGEAIPIALPQRMTHQVQMKARLEAVASQADQPERGSVAAQAQQGGGMLVAIDYL
ncbi:type 1 fimbrial protein [Herbaspirillum sp. YR522]|uniref:type 1 fimbrial protein n=1 Tax=Herbaspirillum sp. YR522 TaxID=1144342 RepID=UPI00026F4AF2|nr:type 1 fimbrial protein [Herbaspirillum sp. YR522]EJN02059.1 P pilus assembly protein, pilin FimA [Herbaspirillum sp. YR522]